jgi:hypothetical protein
VIENFFLEKETYWSIFFLLQSFLLFDIGKKGLIGFSQSCKVVLRALLIQKLE